MSKVNNTYIKYVEKFINDHAKIDFIFAIDKYEQIDNQLTNIDNNIKEIVSACYSLFYTALNYHLMIENNNINKSYAILAGDYISSYVSEILYNQKLFDLLNIFIKNTKAYSINKIKNIDQDNLLLDIINYFNQVK